MVVLDTLGLDPVDLAARFDEQIDQRSGAIDRYWQYYRGQAHVLYATVKYRQHFGRLLSEISDNWCEVIVDSAVERLQVTGFRFGDDDVADDKAWEIWQASYLDAAQVEAHEAAGVGSLCYLLVEPPGDDRDLPRISPLDALEAATMNAPDDKRRRLAGYRRWIDPFGNPQARLYLADTTLVLMGDPDRTPAAEPLGADSRTSQGSSYGDWQVVDEIDNPAGVVPMVEMVNKAHLGRGGGSDLDPVLSKQDQINKLCVDMVVNSEFAGFAQRYATGIEITTDDAGHTVPPDQFLAGPSSVFISENDQAKFGAFPVSDGQTFVRQIEMLVQHVAAQTRTPPHYLTAGLGQWPSGDSLRASEEGLVQKCLRKILGFGESWEESMRIAFLMIGDEKRGQAHALESVWANPQRVSLAATTDAAVKMYSSLDVPRRAVWRILGASPQEIQQWETELEAEKPPEPPPPPPGQPPPPPGTPPPPPGTPEPPAPGAPAASTVPVS
jgi:hypothetical protein